MEIKDIIRKKREELNLTYEQLGDLVGVGKSTVRKWETGMIENMRRDNIVSLAKVLNISPAVIMGWEDTEEIKNLNNNGLSKKEMILLSSFNKLNDLGKNEAIKRVEELTEINKYIEEEKEYLKPLAAHDKKGDFSKEDKEHDLNIMKDDDLWK